MNTLDDCDLLEKVVNISNVHEHNDVTLSIKVQQFKCRFPKGRYGYAEQNDKLQFRQLNTFMLDSDITVEGLPQTLNTFLCIIHN